MNMMCALKLQVTHTQVRYTLVGHLLLVHVATIDLRMGISPFSFFVGIGCWRLVSLARRIGVGLQSFRLVLLSEGLVVEEKLRLSWPTTILSSFFSSSNKDGDTRLPPPSGARQFVAE